MFQLKARFLFVILVAPLWARAQSKAAAPLPECFNSQSTSLMAPMVPVGDYDPPNPPDPRFFASIDKGSVAHFFEIGKFEVSNAQYVAFLNSVARVRDDHHLYDTRMTTEPEGGIERYRVGSKYYYCAKDGFADKPVNFVSWLSAARFVNYLDFLQSLADGLTPIAQEPTEGGAYALTGSVQDYLTVHRNLSATWALPNVDEWYKAAYYDPTKGPSGGYWLFGGQTDQVPTPGAADENGDLLPPSGGYDAVVNFDNHATWAGRFAGGNVTSVENVMDESYYGAQNTDGNLAEMTEQLFFGNDGRQIWGGSFRTRNTVVGSGPEGSFLRLVLILPITFYTDPIDTMRPERPEVGFRVIRLYPPSRLATKTVLDR